MSSLYDSSGKSIPVGILVKNAKQPERTERPTPRRKSEDGEKQIPWLWIAGGGSAAWIVIVLVIAFLTRGQERTAEEERPAIVRAVDGPMAEAAPAANVVRIVNAVDDGPDNNVAQPAQVRAPLLNPKQVRGQEAPPPIDIPPEDFKGENAQFVPHPAPGAEPKVQKKALPRKEIDLNVFANCEQIGTDVLFVKDPPKAFVRAKEEKKLVFMVHLSGNLEDPGFT